MPRNGTVRGSEVAICVSKLNVTERSLLGRPVRTMSWKRLQLSLGCRDPLLLSSLRQLRIEHPLLRLLYPRYLLGERVTWDVQHSKHVRAAPIDISPLRTIGALAKSVSLTFGS